MNGRKDVVRKQQTENIRKISKTTLWECSDQYFVFT